MQLTENMVAISFNTSLQKYGGDMAVASMSILNSVMQFVMLLLPGLVQGAQPLLSYNLGAKNLSRVKKTFRLLLLCGISGSFLIWLACMSALETVASVFTDDPVLIRYTGRTMRIYLAMLFIYGICVLASISSGLVHEIPEGKGNLARQLFLAHPELKRELWGGHLWNPSYCAVTVSDRSREQIMAYIEGQKEKENRK